MNPFRIVGTGLFALDVIVRSDGRMAKCALGGSAGNVLSILGALGWHTTPVGSMGVDAAANVLCDEMKDLGADLRFMRRSSSCVTPVIYQHQLTGCEGQTHRFSFSCPRCGEARRPTHLNFDLPDSTTSQISSPDVFFLDRATATGLAMAKRFSDEGGVVVFEPSSICDDTDLFNEILKCVQIVKYAEDRIKSLEMFDTSRVAIEIRTAGAEGLKYRTQTEWRHLNAFKIENLHDTSGAGDWCTAGLLYQLFANGLDDIRRISPDRVELALRFGQYLSGLNCMTEGARGLFDVISSQQVAAVASELRNVLTAELMSTAQSYKEALSSEDLFKRYAGGDSCARPSSDDSMFCYASL